MKTINKTNSKNIINTIKQQNKTKETTVCLETYGLSGEKTVDLVLNVKPTLYECLSIVKNIVDTTKSDDGINFMFTDFNLFANYLDVLTNLDISVMSLEDIWTLYMYTDLKEKIFSALQETEVHFEIEKLLEDELKFVQSQSISNIQNKSQMVLKEIEDYAVAMQSIADSLQGVDANKVNNAMNLIINGDFGKEIVKSGVNNNDKDKSE